MGLFIIDYKYPNLVANGMKHKPPVHYKILSRRCRGFYTSQLYFIADIKLVCPNFIDLQHLILSKSVVPPINFPFVIITLYDASKFNISIAFFHIPLI